MRRAGRHVLVPAPPWTNHVRQYATACVGAYVPTTNMPTSTATDSRACVRKQGSIRPDPNARARQVSNARTSLPYTNRDKTSYRSRLQRVNEGMHLQQAIMMVVRRAGRRRRVQIMVTVAGRLAVPCSAGHAPHDTHTRPRRGPPTWTTTRTRSRDPLAPPAAAACGMPEPAVEKRKKGKKKELARHTVSDQRDASQQRKKTRVVPWSDETKRVGMQCKGPCCRLTTRCRARDATLHSMQGPSRAGPPASPSPWARRGQAA